MLEGGRSESRILPSKVKPLVHCSKASSRTNGTEKYPFPKEGDGGLEPIALQLMAVKYQSMTWIFHYAGGSECSGAEDAMIRKGVGCVSLALCLRYRSTYHFRPLQTAKIIHRENLIESTK